MKSKEVKHRQTATRLAAANAVLFLTVFFTIDLAVTEFKIAADIPHFRFWLWLTLSVSAVIVTLYYEWAYLTELHDV